MSLQKIEYGVVINAGGLGTRLSEAYNGLPKALVPIFNKPIIIDQINKFIFQGFQNFYILLRYKSEQIIKILKKEYQNSKINIEFFIESEPLGSGGSLLAHLNDLPENFIFTYCDIYFDLDISKMILFHERNLSRMTILVHPNDHPYDSDLISIKSNNIVDYLKPHPHTYNNYPGNIVNAAFYVVNKICLSGLKNTGQKQDFAQDIIPRILSNFKVFGYKTPEFLKDIGTPTRLEKVKQSYYNRFRSGKQNRVICLDRDGTMNKCADGDYITRPKDFELFDGVSKAIMIFRKLGFFVFCVTNQPVIARGEIDVEGLKKIHLKMEWLLGIQNTYLDEIFFCPHHTDSGYLGEVVELKIDCDCRKPKTGLLDQVMEYVPFDISESWFVGDSWRDVMCGQAYGMRTCSVGAEDLGADVRVENLLQFAKILQKNEEFL